MIVRFKISSRKDPWWWCIDRKGYKIHAPLAIHRTTHKDRRGVVWSIIVGPLALHVAFDRTSNAQADRPAKAGERGES